MPLKPSFQNFSHLIWFLLFIHKIKVSKSLFAGIKRIRVGRMMKRTRRRQILRDWVLNLFWLFWLVKTRAGFKLLILNLHFRIKRCLFPKMELGFWIWYLRDKHINIRKCARCSLNLVGNNRESSFICFES